ncbi:MULTISPECIES: patatin-like phospholipase family protein [unclassified Bradyrhizobium]|uniref:patatin-like phospholipase family protein n=1 Tax=unclassified Bradyrhizobium TaxID=2631580 RepID=UPI0024799A0E|nr:MULTISPECIES: patatin-like phospholipase family protein [unclassified Bradyrhizobium]WGR74626.1 patatin-like phospholipase family protein [Bradyrhizobium sp. ISRA426]WGR79461.1 patatin-like phospholipase family protein [Bradyrhizobium sp. ISRA430]WGR89798.1 patatin-like phospholipase family protein [Bradyrhizobium sp. ISRA432]
MSEKIVGTHDEGGLQGAARTPASMLLAAADIWSGAPSPSPAPVPAPSSPHQRTPDPVVQAPAPIVSVTAVAARTPTRVRSEQWPPQKLSLALQGGGTFAAFTWGVLERLLEEPAIEINTISGASAGAINALLLASGLAEGGREAARARLNRFWVRLMHEASFRSLMLVGGFSPAGSSVAFGPTLRSGQFDPFDLDPLRQALSRDINFAALCQAGCPKLLIAATRIRDGQQQIFGNDAITADVALASTCPPLVHCAIEIDGEAYWDGGFGGNPPLLRLAQHSTASDLLLVQVTPARDSYVPITLAAIDRRLDQIAANAALNAEVAALEWARPHAAPDLRLFRLAAEDEIEGLAQRSSADLGRGFIRLLHRSGREAAERWLRKDAGVSKSSPKAPDQKAVRAEPALV